MSSLRFCVRLPAVVLLSLAFSAGCGSSQEAAGGGGRAGGGSNSGSSGEAASGGAGGTSVPGRGGSSQASTAGSSSASGASTGTAGSSSAGGSGSGGAPATGPITCRTKGDGKSTISFLNRCPETLSFRGSDIEGGTLLPGEHACRDVGNEADELPAIRFWGFSGEDPGGEKHTLAELTLNTDFNDFDWYNISHVDAHNLPMQVAPVEMDSCRVLTCDKSLLADCPTEGQLEDASGKLISCFSPHRDDKDSTVAKYFEAGCADAYSWSGDDQESVAACAGEDYDVIFCP